jgi:hypothetical protein
MDKTVQVVDHDTAAQPLPGPLDEVVSSVKPRLRGWLHAGASPLALAAGIVLISQAPTSAGVIGGVVFLTASVLLFGTSGLYHRFTWSRRGEAVLRRMDHANIYVFIAATYTPLALMLLNGGSRVLLLAIVWAAALGGLLFRLCRLAARWPSRTGVDHRRRPVLHDRRGRVRAEAARSLPCLVRVSRDLSCLHHRRVRLPLHCDLAGDLRRDIAVARPACRVEPRAQALTL